MLLRFFPAALLAILCTAVIVAEGPTRQSSIRPDLANPSVPGEVLVRLTESAARLTDEMLASRLGIEVTGRIEELGTVRGRLLGGEETASAVARLGRLLWVEYAEPNHVVRASFVPNDPLYSGQSNYLNLIQAPSAWDVEQGQASVVVAVLDSGIDEDHEDLAEKLWANILETAANGADDDGNGCVDDVHGCGFVTRTSADSSCNMPPNAGIRDDNGHGTFVAGIIGAKGNNLTGITGAAPGVSIMAVKILDCRGGGTAADAAQGLLYAARMGARVANLSFGADGESLTLANAIREAHNRYGLVIVTATGNEGANRVSFPARLPETIAVASAGIAGDADARSPFSDWGPEVSVAAPGLNIISTVPANFCNSTWLCVQGQPYALASGTSFAAPFVSALAALIISHTANLSPDAVRDIITSTAEHLPDGDTPNWAGAGRIQMSSALGVRRFYLGAAGTSKH